LATAAAPDHGVNVAFALPGVVQSVPLVNSELVPPDSLTVSLVNGASGSEVNVSVVPDEVLAPLENVLNGTGWPNLM
jgi:hypothetical protein